MKSGKSYILAAVYNGSRFNSPNDLVIDEKGRIYFTDPRYLGPEMIEQNGMNVYRIDSDGSVHLAAANVAKPNGLVLSPDQQTLYVANSDFPGNGRPGFRLKKVRFGQPVKALFMRTMLSRMERCSSARN